MTVCKVYPTAIKHNWLVIINNVKYEIYRRYIDDLKTYLRDKHPGCQIDVFCRPLKREPMKYWW